VALYETFTDMWLCVRHSLTFTDMWLCMGHSLTFIDMWLYETFINIH